MSMRVSTLQMNNVGVSGIQRLQSNLYTLQNQVNTGRKIVSPQDDPIGAAQALLVNQSKSVNDLYVKNQQTATTKLNTLDSTLRGVNEELSNIYDKVVAAGNGSYSDSERASIATELSQRLNNLIGLANTQDGTGRYVFSGVKSTTTPFSLSGNTASTTSPHYSVSGGNPYVVYNGDDGLQKLQVGADQFVDTNIPGSEVFMRLRNDSGNVTGRSVFDSIQNAIDFLKTPGVSASNTQYTTALGDINAAMNTVSDARASVGARLSSLDSMANTSADRKLQYKEQLSNLQDLDYAEALTSVSQQKMQLEAAQSTYALTAKLSLFDYIS